MSEITYISHNNHIYIQLEKEISRLSAAVATKNQSLSFIHEELKIRDTRIKELQTKIADEVAVSKRLRGEITDLNHNLSVSMITICGLQASLSRKKKDFRDNIKKLNDSCDEKVKFLEENRDSLYTKTRYLDSYKEEIESLRMNYASHSGRIRYLEKANSKLVTENRQFLDKIDRLKQDLLINNRLKEKTAEPEQDSLVNKHLNERVESQAAQLAYVLKTVSVLHNMTESLKRERNRFQAEWRSSEEIRSVLEAELAEYMKQVGNLDLMKRFDPNFCNRIDSWMETKKENREIPEAAKNERS